MEDNIKSKNIKFNMDTDDKLIVEYFQTHKEKFSTIAKELLLEYVIKSKNNKSRSIMDVLEDHTRLLEQIVEKGMTVSSIENNRLEEKQEEIQEEVSVDKEGEIQDFNINFLEQL